MDRTVPAQSLAVSDNSSSTKLLWEEPSPIDTPGLVDPAESSQQSRLPPDRLYEYIPMNTDPINRHNVYVALKPLFKPLRRLYKGAESANPQFVTMMIQFEKDVELGRVSTLEHISARLERIRLNCLVGVKGNVSPAVQNVLDELGDRTKTILDEYRQSVETHHAVTGHLLGIRPQASYNASHAEGQIPDGEGERRRSVSAVLGPTEKFSYTAVGTATETGERANINDTDWMAPDFQSRRVPAEGNWLRLLPSRP